MAATAATAAVNRHLESLRQLDCSGAASRAAERVRAAKFPYSLQSAKMRPVEADPALVTLTLRTSGEIRIVHGNKDIFDAVKKAVAIKEEVKKEEEKESKKEGEEEPKKEEEEDKDNKKEDEEKKEEGKDEKKEEKKEEGDEKEKTDEKKEEAASAKETKQHKDWEEENNEKNGLWKTTLLPSGDNEMTEKDKLLVTFLS